MRTLSHETNSGGYRGGGGGEVLGVRTLPFGGPPNFIKRGEMFCVCARMAHVLVLNSYADPHLSEILYPPLTNSLYTENALIVN